jgi:phosphoserine phosphatase
VIRLNPSDKKKDEKKHFAKHAPRRLESEEETDERLEALRRQRDALNKDARALAQINKEQIAKYRECAAEAGEARKKRDAENAVVKQLAGEKKKIEGEISGAKQALAVARKNLAGMDEFVENPERIQEEIERLEWLQQTEAHSAREEKEFGRRIAELKARLPRSATAVAALKELRETRAKLGALVEKAKALGARIRERAAASDTLHAEVIKASERAERISQKISQQFASLDETRARADAQHRSFVEAKRATRASEENEAARELAARRARERKAKSALGERAKRLFEEFKKGKKLSMDELLILQEAGAV